MPRLEDINKAKGSKSKGRYLSKCAMLKLNGGLGTGMGLEKAKSLLEVKDGNTFLDLIAQQVKHARRQYRKSVKFILMNSFSTSADTRAHLSKHHADLVSEPFFEFLQNKSPKVDAATLGPALHPDGRDLEWCPPGHGDIYASLVGSGMLDRLLKDGVEYLFVSNSDNLGATLDLELLDYFAESGAPFLMECCARTAADKKGGHLCKTRDGKLILRESAQCPEKDEGSFQDVAKHRFFNTNNLWVSLPHLKRAMEAEGGALRLPLIKNEKNINPRDKSTPKCLQLETAMGAAIGCFEGARAIVVQRSRFAPVKTCADLFALRSDAYTLTPDFTVVLSSARGQVPLVKLDDKHYKMVGRVFLLLPQPTDN